MTIDDPQALADITAAFHEYERALMADDVPAMDALFHDSPQRKLGRVAITVYGDRFATADAEFFREGGDRRGRQTQAWVKFADGWKVVSAHVSLEGSTS